MRAVARASLHTGSSLTKLFQLTLQSARTKTVYSSRLARVGSRARAGSSSQAGLVGWHLGLLLLGAEPLRAESALRSEAGHSAHSLAW